MSSERHVVAVVLLEGAGDGESVCFEAAAETLSPTEKPSRALLERRVIVRGEVVAEEGVFGEEGEAEGVEGVAE